MYAILNNKEMKKLKKTPKGVKGSMQFGLCVNIADLTQHLFLYTNMYVCIHNKFRRNVFKINEYIFCL